MGVIATATVKLGADSASFNNEVEKMKKKNRGFLDELNAQYGKKSTIGKVFKLAAGGGVIAGLALAANEFKNLTEHAGEMYDKFRAGNTTAGELADEVAKSLPIIGKVYEGFKNIGEIVSGVRGEVAALNESARLNDLITAAMKRGCRW
jgi:hypothetical protein